MNVKQLGKSDLNITPLGFGAWAIGGAGYEWGWGAQDDADSIAAIHEALDAGVNWIDTAAVYGLGRSEEVVAQRPGGRAAAALRLHQVRHGLGRAGARSATASRPTPSAASARPACAGCGWTASTSTRSTGRTAGGH